MKLNKTIISLLIFSVMAEFFLAWLLNLKIQIAQGEGIIISIILTAFFISLFLLKITNRKFLFFLSLAIGFGISIYMLAKLITQWPF